MSPDSLHGGVPGCKRTGLMVDYGWNMYPGEKSHLQRYAARRTAAGSLVATGSCSLTADVDIVMKSL